MTLGKLWAEVVKDQLEDILLARVNRLSPVVELVDNIDDELSKASTLEIWDFFGDFNFCNAGFFFIECEGSNDLCTPYILWPFLKQNGSLALWPHTQRFHSIERGVHYRMLFSFRATFGGNVQVQVRQWLVVTCHFLLACIERNVYFGEVLVQTWHWSFFVDKSF